MRDILKMNKITLFTCGMICLGSGGILTALINYRYWLPILFDADWACYTGRMFLFPWENCDNFEIIAKSMTLIALILSAVGLFSMIVSRNGIKPLMQRISYWSIFLIFVVGLIGNGYYVFIMRGVSPTIYNLLVVYFPVAILIFLVVYFGILQTQSSPSLYASGAIISLVGGIASILLGILIIILTSLPSFSWGFLLNMILIIIFLSGGIMSIFGAILAIKEGLKTNHVKIIAIGAFLGGINVLTLVGVGFMIRSMDAKK